MGVAAMYFGGANPVLTTHWAVCSWIFRFRRCLVFRHMAFHPKFVLMMPYIVTIAVLAISMIAKISANKKRESSPACGKLMMKKDKTL